MNCGFRSLNGKASSINPVIKQTLFYRLQSSTNLFRTGKKKHELGEQNETCLLLKSHHSY